MQVPLPGGNSDVLSHDDSVFIGSGASDWCALRSGASTNFSNALVANRSSSSDNSIYACQGGRPGRLGAGEREAVLDHGWIEQ